MVATRQLDPTTTCLDILRTYGLGITTATERDGIRVTKLEMPGSNGHVTYMLMETRSKFILVDTTGMDPNTKAAHLAKFVRAVTT